MPTVKTVSVAGDFELYKKPIALHKAQKIWMPIGKVASVSVQKSLTEPLVFITKDQMQWTYANWPVVAVIRHPCDRLVSAYAYFKEVNPGVSLGLDTIKNGKDIKDFDSFIEEIFNCPDDVTNCHLRSQLALLSHQNKFLPTVVIPFEKLETIKHYLPIDTLICNKKTRSTHRPWNEYYNAKTMRMVEKRFAGDLELYNTYARGNTECLIKRNVATA